MANNKYKYFQNDCLGGMKIEKGNKKLHSAGCRIGTSEFLALMVDTPFSVNSQVTLMCVCVCACVCVMWFPWKLAVCT